MRISGVTYVPRKSHKVRNIFIFAVILTFLAALVILLISTYTGWTLTHPQHKSIPAFSSNIVPEYKDVNFMDINNKVNLKGWLFETKGSSKTVILAHGYRQNRLQFGEQTLDMIKSLQNSGYSVLTFDFRNSGMSEGKVTSVGLYEKDDLLGAVKYIKSQGSKNIILMGFSMGAATSLLAAADSKDVDAVIADSPFSDLHDYLSNNLPVWSHLPPMFNSVTLLSIKLMTGLDSADVSPIKTIGNFAPRPILFIHSNDDKDIPVENSRMLYKLYSDIQGSKAELWLTDGAAHAQSYKKYPAEYMDKVLKFLEKVK